ncbi:MAG: hypothetical protein AAGK78_17190, partial [Planctomycetota bacterium]
VLKGDFGIVDSQNASVTALTGSTATINAAGGNLRALAGSSVGFYDEENNAEGYVNFRAAFSVGRISASGIGGAPYAGDVFVNRFGVLGANGLPIVSQAVGDDIQVVRAARDLAGNFVAGRGIGSLVADGNWGVPNGGFAGSIYTNADDINDDGFVDIISVNNLGGPTRFGFLSDGPGIDVGTNGNVRYINATGVISRDPFFGGSGVADDFIPLQPGESFTYTDDSGTEVVVEPFPLERNIDFNPVTDDPSEEFSNVGTLEVFTYPIRSGGSVLVNLRSDTSVQITTNDRGPR